ncbi:hypothetical protein D3272_18045 [Lichenibacterium ramalinae]|uniref:Uncharacterized protein n=2 Tax=Lichenibacterium ramalinae TaxID=2316527 RepID=A0A4Q2R949_9HYPH|nr:hypothetical protein D3272_18045 [Lichenibacterium ramalinae]
MTRLRPVDGTKVRPIRMPSGVRDRHRDAAKLQRGAITLSTLLKSVTDDPMIATLESGSDPAWSG